MTWQLHFDYLTVIYVLYGLAGKWKVQLFLLRMTLQIFMIVKTNSDYKCGSETCQKLDGNSVF
jgi:hypothetical protein